MQMADYGSVAEWLLVVSVAIKQPTPPLHLARELSILRRIMKQVPIDIVGHGDRRVPNHRLDGREQATLPDHFRKTGSARRDRACHPIQVHAVQRRNYCQHQDFRQCPIPTLRDSKVVLVIS